MTTTEQLTENCVALLTQALAEKATAIVSVLQDSPEGKHSFSVSFKLTFVGSRIYVAETLSHSTKDKVDLENSFEINDPSAPKLPGLDVEDSQ